MSRLYTYSIMELIPYKSIVLLNKIEPQGQMKPHYVCVMFMDDRSIIEEALYTQIVALKCNLPSFHLSHDFK